MKGGIQILPLISYLVLLVRRILSVAWLRLCIFIGQREVVSTDARHKVVVIGDTLALGLGDWVTVGEIGGVSSHILRVSSGGVERWVRQQGNSQGS